MKNELTEVEKRYIECLRRSELTAYEIAKEYFTEKITDKDINKLFDLMLDLKPIPKKYLKYFNQLLEREVQNYKQIHEYFNSVGFNNIKSIRVFYVSYLEVDKR
jgi:hypothetical protein